MSARAERQSESADDRYGGEFDDELDPELVEAIAESDAYFAAGGEGISSVEALRRLRNAIGG